MTGRVLCVSFADGAFSRRKTSFENEARRSAFFDDVHVYTLSSLPKEFCQRHGDYIQSQSRGFGYWIWKSVVLKDALENADIDDIICYLDAGFIFNNSAKTRFIEYLKITQDTTFKMLTFKNIFIEAHFTKSDLARKLGIDVESSLMLTSQTSSGFFLCSPTAMNLDLAKQWAEISVAEGYRFSDDSPSRIENHSGFKEHRHDQSIFSLLTKQRGVQTTFYEAARAGPDAEARQAASPVWAARRRG